MTKTRRTMRKPRRATPSLVAFAVVAGLAAATVPVADAGTPKPGPPKPTVILVHGAWSDGAGWTDVVKRLQRDGYTVKAPAVPLRDLAGDTVYLSSLIRNTEGPVILVGHSYGGAVITGAATGNGNVKALVYIAGFAPDTGESLADLGARPVDHPIAPLPVQPRTFRQPDGTQGTDLYLDPAKYGDVFTGNRVPRGTAAALAAEQRPISAAAYTGKAQSAAWTELPTWYLVARNDRAIAPDLERYMAARAHAHVVEANAPHLAMVTDPGPVTDVIEQAARATR